MAFTGVGTMTETTPETNPEVTDGLVSTSAPSSSGDRVLTTTAVQGSLTSLLSASWAVLMPQIGASIRQQVSEALQGAGINQG